MARNRMRFRRRGPLPEVTAEHAYFESLLTHPNFVQAVSYRPVPGQTDSSSPYWEDQLLENDDGGYQVQLLDNNPLAFEYDATEDAAKLTLFPFVRLNDNVLASGVAAASSGDTTVLSCTNVTTSYSVNLHMKIDDEVMKITARDATADTITVLRGQQGTTATEHLAGAITYRITNGTSAEMYLPAHTASEVNRFFFVWDAKYTDSYVATGLTNHKTYQFEGGDDAVWFQIDTAYSPTAASEGDFNPVTDVGALQVRSLSSQLGTGTIDDEPLQPIANTFAIKPNVWTRYFVLLDMRSLSDFASYSDCLANLAEDITDVGATSFSVETGSVDSDVGWFGQRQYIKIDNEIMRLTADANSGNPRTLTVTRGEKGTLAATHTSGAAIEVCANVSASVWIADENREPVAHFTDLRVSAHGSNTPENENQIAFYRQEWNTSNDSFVARSTRDLVSYHRNWAELKGAALDPVADGLLVKPVSA